MLAALATCLLQRSGMAVRVVVTVARWEEPLTKSSRGKDLGCGGRRGRRERLQEIQHPG